MKPRELAAYLFLAIAWGLSFLVLLKVVDAFGWVGAVTFRCLIAGVTLLAVAAAIRKRLDFRPGWARFAVVGATTVAGQLVGLSYGVPLIGTAMGAILVASIPLFGMIIAQAWGLERVNSRNVTGLVLGTIGIVLLVGFPVVPITWSFILGAAATLAACFCAAFGSNYAARYLRQAGAWEVTTAAFLSGGVMTLPLLLAVPVPRVPGPVDYLYLLILGAIMSALTYVTYFRLVTAIGPTKAISVEFAVTVVAVLVGALFLGETLSLVQFAGAVVIVAGCALVLGLVPPRAARR